ncbi:MAG TPA: phospho-N-acetylmuramoyl-pentapeptide-transferase [Longimicrobiales bacterium]
MLYHFLSEFADRHIFFNLFRYITFRAAGAAATALLITFVFGPPIIRRLRALRVGQVVRQEGPETHLAKAGTPTMGGVLIVAAAVVSTLLWAQLTNAYVIYGLLILVWTAGIGFLDDYLKVVRRRTEGLVGKYKLTGQGLAGLGLGVLLLVSPLGPMPAEWTSLPFFSDYHLEIWKPLFVPWVMLVIAGSSNAVNLSDGLDGLAAGLSAIAAATFAALAYIVGRVDLSSYLGLFYLPGTGELAVFCTALAGATLGFLWYNAHPAEVFMGDTGSLALGGAIGAIAVMLKAEFLLIIVGGVFVAEAMSVMLQVTYFRYTLKRYGKPKRLFLMSPLHHHFEKKGWDESKIIARFWILGILCALVAMSTLKVR